MNNNYINNNNNNDDMQCAIYVHKIRTIWRINIVNKRVS